jgi:enoyl-CoA hydratase/carnithine racemase
MTGDDVRLERRGAIWIVTLSRPEVLNAVRAETIDRLLGVLAEAAAVSELRALVITGAGRAFSSGRDLRELAASTDDPAGERRSIEQLQSLTQRLVQHPAIVCAAVNGLAVGLGAELAVACDVRFAADSASFSFPEAQRGVFVTGGVLYLLPRLVGAGRAAHWLISGATVSAAEALGAGLVTQVVPGARLLDAVLAFAGQVAQAAPQSIRLLKQGLRRAGALDLDGVLALEAEGALTCLASEEARDRLRAFLQKK